MKDFELLSDEELNEIYEEAKRRTQISLSYGKNYKEQFEIDEEKRFQAAKEKYVIDHENYLKKREEAYERFLKNEEHSKHFHEIMQESQIRFWEQNKKNMESLGKTVDESTRPKITPYKEKTFYFGGLEPQMPVRKSSESIDVNSCSMILKSFQFKNNQVRSFHSENGYIYLAGNSTASEYFVDELEKEKTVVEGNRKKIEYLTLREHYIQMREERCCKISDMYSDDPEKIGKLGEKLTVFELEFMKMKKYKGKILYNVYVPFGNGQFAQVDILFVCPKGILVIESKNYSDRIQGNENSDNWIIEKTDIKGSRYNYNRKSNIQYFYNPVKQNKKHIEAVQNIFKGIPCFSLIVFSERCKLENINVSASTALVFKRFAMINAFSKIYNSNPDVLSDDMIKYVTDTLEQYTNPDSTIKRVHNDNIRDNITHNYSNLESFDNFDDYGG